MCSIELVEVFAAKSIVLWVKWVLSYNSVSQLNERIVVKVGLILGLGLGVRNVIYFLFISHNRQ